jgi:hypothetical protein
MNYAIEITSGDMIYMRSFIKIGSDMQKLLGRGYTCRDTDGRVIP